MSTTPTAARRKVSKATQSKISWKEVLPSDAVKLEKGCFTVIRKNIALTVYWNGDGIHAQQFLMGRVQL